ncbi:M14 family zinc carboxypeptidase [Capnocytophaga cynodegmi]|uniref:Putative Conserved Metallocarboxypeptidase D n=1 Tax=Capnocytophaga cynodegmi TaxID=28189 RepID=A0A0B7HE90_9FLAO|nr:M14 family zinc carboxypeptidase [Capnocytophaga cynodegmi]CEN37580.1 putative Conserved Metallocarboxypeptidase D [Capnocytophaga cynodegmi]
MEYNQFKEERISGRYINFEMILPILQNYNIQNKIILGKSVYDKPIYLYQIGNGGKKILMWSQMHGNESTTTKSLLDTLNYFTKVNDSYLQKLSLFFVPILNPDGAEVYTRVNANKVDLNRDAFELSQPESKCLRKAFELVKPDFCFNLHDQRTIFSAGKTKNPATISFLAPSYNENRDINIVRRKSMEVISVMNEMLQKYIPNQIGRFDDSFNINCTGDYFTSVNTSTILFEAGHYRSDYLREETRKYVCFAMIEGLKYIADNDVSGSEYEPYFEIPENDKLFFDVLLRDDFYQNTIDIGILFKEALKNNTIYFEPYISKIGNLKNYYGHKEYRLSEIFINKIDKKDIEKQLDLKKFEPKFV